MTIGGLIAARELTTNALEILSGAAADRLGRRRAMVVSYVESQGRSIVAAILAPLLGLAVDSFGGTTPSFVPLGVLALAAPALVLLVLVLRGRGQEAPKPRR